MKKRLSLLLLLLAPIAVFSQNFTSLTLKQAQEKAQKEKKIIMVDVTNDRNHNDQKKEMQRKMVANKEVNKFVNEKTIAIRVFMGTDAGKEFAPLLQMNMYPTYAFLMPNGDLLKVISPMIADKEPQKLIDVMNEAWKSANEKWNNSKSINFKDISFEEALALAKKEGKYIFIDAITDNCQPCMMMSKNVFTLDRVAEFYNSNFINLKLNLGTQHKDLAFRYRTSMYPAYLFIDGDGNMIHRGGGYCEADKFMELGDAALNKREVQFHHAKYNDLLQIAKQTGKHIFIDCYTSWCGPCKQMSNVVFKELPVADYLNTNFICAKYDMERGEGIELKDKLGVKAYPTFIILDSEGKEAHRIVGSASGTDFVNAIKEGLREGSISKMRELYNNGTRDNQFLFKYLVALDKAYFKDEAQAVAIEFFKNADLGQLSEPLQWRLFDRYQSDYRSPSFKYVLGNRAKFDEKLGKSTVDRKLMNVWKESAKSFLVTDNNAVALDKKGYNAYKKEIKKVTGVNFDEIVFEADLFYADKSNNWNEFASLIENRFKKAGISAIAEHQFYNWMKQLEKNCKDKAVLSKAALWCGDMLTEVTKRRELEKEKAGGAMRALPMIDYLKEFQRMKEQFGS